MEIVVVTALLALMITASFLVIGSSKTSADISNFNSDVNQIIQGVNEYYLISKKIPTGASWPAVLDDFVDASMRARYTYKCDASTSNKVRITSVGTFGSDPTNKLKDQKLCSSTGTTYNTSKTVTCQVSVFEYMSCS